MTHNVYRTIEEGMTQYIQKEYAERLAQLYGVPITHFIDEYNQFLYDGQAKRIRAYRKSLKLGMKPFARKYGIPLTSLRHWEKGLKTISRASWERYFKGKA
jgi:transcriptional regulator with XRE-family HTH domain